MVVLPDTAKVLTFDDRRHIYRLKGIELPSVTQVMKPLSDETYRSVEPRVLNRAADKERRSTMPSRITSASALKTSTPSSPATSPPS